MCCPPSGSISVACIARNQCAINQKQPNLLNLQLEHIKSVKFQMADGGGDGDGGSSVQRPKLKSLLLFYYYYFIMNKRAVMHLSNCLHNFGYRIVKNLLTKMDNRIDCTARRYVRRTLVVERTRQPDKLNFSHVSKMW